LLCICAGSRAREPARRRAQGAWDLEHAPRARDPTRPRNRAGRDVKHGGPSRPGQDRQQMTISPAHGRRVRSFTGPRPPARPRSRARLPPRPAARGRRGARTRGALRALRGPRSRSDHPVASPPLTSACRCSTPGSRRMTPPADLLSSQRGTSH
jgi:hypothetical protein